MRLNEYGLFATWSYQRPAERTSYREIWRGDAPMVTEWAVAFRSPCGTYFETSKGRRGFASEAEAIAAANAVIGASAP